MPPNDTTSVMPAPWFKAFSSPYNVEHGLRSNPVRFADESRGERMVGVFVLPPFQRGLVWTEAQKVALIEGMWEGFPIGNYVFNDDDDFGDDNPHAWLLDGQQRWSTIVDYVSGAFPVRGHRFDEIPKVERRRFLSKEFTMLRTKLATEAECRRVYEQLAYGGTPHLKAAETYVIDGKDYRLVEIALEDESRQAAKP